MNEEDEKINPNGAEPFSFKDILSRKAQAPKVKAPAYEWQDFALKVIGDLSIPAFKRSAVFKICKDESKAFVEACLNDTKELCQGGIKWKYFFKVIENKRKEKADRL